MPFGAPNKAPGTLYNAEYRTALDLKNKVYFFELSTAPNVIWMNLKKFNLDSSAPVLALDPDNIALAGNVTDKFKRQARRFDCGSGISLATHKSQQDTLPTLQVVRDT